MKYFVSSTPEDPASCNITKELIFLFSRAPQKCNLALTEAQYQWTAKAKDTGCYHTVSGSPTPGGPILQHPQRTYPPFHTSEDPQGPYNQPRYTLCLKVLGKFLSFVVGKADQDIRLPATNRWSCQKIQPDAEDDAADGDRQGGKKLGPWALSCLF